MKPLDRVPRLARADRFIRRMRGGAQSRLIACDDGDLYVVKFSNNPQHRRILINEWLANAIARRLGIDVPATALVAVSEEFVERFPECDFAVGSKRLRPAAGLHFGSRLPVDPDKTALFDFLPDRILPRVANLRDFWGVLALDKWLGNTDSRQAVFFRGRGGLRARMIDHGCAFGGEAWEFRQAPGDGLYCRPEVYRGVSSLADFAPWLDAISNFPAAALRAARRELPEEWIGPDARALETLLARLMARRDWVGRWIETSRRFRPDSFPGWLDAGACRARQA